MGLPVCPANRIVGALADHVKFSLESRLVHTCGAGQEHLLHEGFAGFGGVAQGRVICGDIAPTEHGTSFFGGDFGKDAFATFSRSV